MYRTIIELKEETPKEIAKEIRQEEYNCLQLGSLNLKEIQSFNKWVKIWQWEDEDHDESCDLLEIVSKPAYS